MVDIINEEISNYKMDTDRNQINTNKDIMNIDTDKELNMTTASKDNKRVGININNPDFSKYTYKDIGPYVIHIKHKEFNTGNLHPTKIGKLVFENNTQNVKEIKRINKFTIEIIFQTYKDANNAIEQEIWGENNYNAFIPYNKIRISGVIRGIPQCHTEEEIMLQMESPVPIIGVQRFNRRVYENDSYKLIPTQTVKLLFKSQYLPEAVYLYHTRFPTEKYIYPVIQCKKCQKFGHKEQFCRNEIKCAICSEPHNESKCNIKKPKCANCGLEHKATNQYCMVYTSEKKLKEKMAENRISRTEAKQIMTNPNAFSAISKPDYSSENFPSLGTPIPTTYRQIHPKPNNTIKRVHTDNKQQPTMKKGKTQYSIHDSEILNTKQGVATTTTREVWNVEKNKLQSVNANDVTTPTQSKQEGRDRYKYQNKTKTQMSNYNENPYENKRTLTYFQKEFLSIINHKCLSPEITPLIHKLRDELIPLIRIE